MVKNQNKFRKKKNYRRRTHPQKAQTINMLQ